VSLGIKLAYNSTTFSPARVAGLKPHWAGRMHDNLATSGAARERVVEALDILIEFIAGHMIEGSDLVNWAAFMAWALPGNAFRFYPIAAADTVLTLSQVASSGGHSVYTYSSYTGPDPRVGMTVTITGFGTAGNNVTAVLTAVSGGASGTVTVATTTQGNEIHAGSGAAAEYYNCVLEDQAWEPTWNAPYKYGTTVIIRVLNDASAPATPEVILRRYYGLTN
jgi:hypothetical protein